MTKTRLGVIFGGRSVEHEVSVVSAMQVIEHADAARFEVVPLGVTRAGRWLTPDETRAQLARPDAPFEKRLDADVPPLPQRPEVIAELSRCDVVFPLIHGVNGEDGTLQGMLEMFGLPYVGCGVAASALGMDKTLQKQLFARSGLRVARHVAVTSHEWQRGGDEIAAGIAATVGYPAFVKPASGGSSVGVSKVRSREDLGGAVEAALSLDRTVIVEEAVQGREVECGVLGNEEPQASPVGEVIPAGEFYDYRAKYLEDSARLVAPADLPARVSDELRRMAIDAFRSIGGEGFARVDFFLPGDGAPIVNEINTIPGFTRISMFPRLWALAGIAYGELISRLVDLAMARFSAREALSA